MDNRKKNVMIMGIFILILSIIGFTYAIWNAFFVQKDPNTLATTCFKITFEEDEDFDAITLQKAHPITEEEGLKLNPYKFTVTNNCQDYASYEIHLEIDEESTLSDFNAIHISLNDESFVLGEKDVVEKTLDNTTTAFSLTKGYLNKGQNKDFELRIWIDEGADASVAGQTFTSQVTLTASYAKEIPKTLEETILGLDLETEDTGTSGLYKVTHDDASITYTQDATVQAKLKQPEYRYAGKNPNNYVDVGDRYTNDVYKIFIDGFETSFVIKEEDVLKTEEAIKYSLSSSEMNVSDDNILFKVYFKQNEEQNYIMEFHSIDSIEEPSIPTATTGRLFTSQDECENAKAEMENDGIYTITTDCFIPESYYEIHVLVAISQMGYADTEYNSESECSSDLENIKAMDDGSDSLYYSCENLHQAGDPIYWRIIGLVNTPEGQRVKLVRDASIGEFSWDTSAYDVNNGFGVNEWSQSDLMKLLNEGYGENQLEDSEGVTQDTYVNNSLYWNGGKGQCYDSSGNSASPCDFTNHKMPDSLKDMIEEVTWNTGSNGDIDFQNINVNEFYNLERSNNTGNICDRGCDDVERTTSWQGKVGLIYPSDYGYATIGGTETNRTSCLGQTEDNIVVYDWHSYNECYDNDWLYTGDWNWTLSPYAYSDYAYCVFNVSDDGDVFDFNAFDAEGMRPSVYLKSNVYVKQGNGSKENPYELEG